LVLVVSSHNGLTAPSSPTSISIAKECTRLSESSISECVRLFDVHMAYTYGM